MLSDIKRSVGTAGPEAPISGPKILARQPGVIPSESRKLHDLRRGYAMGLAFSTASMIALGVPSDTLVAMLDPSSGIFEVFEDRWDEIENTAAASMGVAQGAADAVHAWVMGAWERSVELGLRLGHEAEQTFANAKAAIGHRLDIVRSHAREAWAAGRAFVDDAASQLTPEQIGVTLTENAAEILGAFRGLVRIGRMIKANIERRQEEKREPGKAQTKEVVSCREKTRMADDTIGAMMA